MAIGDESQRDFKNASLTQNNKEKKKWCGPAVTAQIVL